MNKLDATQRAALQLTTKLRAEGKLTQPEREFLDDAILERTEEQDAADGLTYFAREALDRSEWISNSGNIFPRPLFVAPDRDGGGWWIYASNRPYAANDRVGHVDTKPTTWTELREAIQ